MKGENAGSIAKEDHRNWYRELFALSVTAGILDASDLAGYRNASVYIRGSMHVPPRCEAVPDAMPAFFNLLRDGDTLNIRMPVRMLSIDTPEITARSSGEYKYSANITNNLVCLNCSTEFFFDSYINILL